MQIGIMQCSDLNTASKRSSSAANRFVLLRWSCVIYSKGVKKSSVKIDTAEWKALIESLALLYDSLLNEDMHAKNALRKTAVLCARRALRSVSVCVTSWFDG